MKRGMHRKRNWWWVNWSEGEGGGEEVVECGEWLNREVWRQHSRRKVKWRV